MLLLSSTNLPRRVLGGVAVSGAKWTAERLGVSTAVVCLPRAGYRRICRANGIRLVLRVLLLLGCGFVLFFCRGGSLMNFSHSLLESG